MTELIHLLYWLWTRVGRVMHKFNHIRQVEPMCPYGRTRCRHLSNNIEASLYGNDVPYVKLFWPLVIFWHAHLHSCTDSQALSTEYCIVGIPHNCTVRHSIWTNQRSTSLIPLFLCQMPFLLQPSQFILAWDKHQICWLAYSVLYIIMLLILCTFCVGFQNNICEPDNILPVFTKVSSILLHLLQLLF